MLRIVRGAASPLCGWPIHNSPQHSRSLFTCVYFVGCFLCASWGWPAQELCTTTRNVATHLGLDKIALHACLLASGTLATIVSHSIATQKVFMPRLSASLHSHGDPRRTSDFMIVLVHSVARN
eukprot:3767053-Amphidinium_carterae.1